MAIGKDLGEQPTPGKTNVDRSAALYDTFILMLVIVVFAIHTGKIIPYFSAPSLAFFATSSAVLVSLFIASLDCLAFSIAG